MSEHLDTQTISAEEAAALSALIGLDFELTAEPDEELDRRTSNGIDVRLLRRPESDSVYVVAHDLTTDRRLYLDVQEGESARDVFDHPYAYEAARIGNVAVERGVD